MAKRKTEPREEERVGDGGTAPSAAKKPTAPGKRRRKTEATAPPASGSRAGGRASAKPDPGPGSGPEGGELPEKAENEAPRGRKSPKKAKKRTKTGRKPAKKAGKPKKTPKIKHSFPVLKTGETSAPGAAPSSLAPGGGSGDGGSSTADGKPIEPGDNRKGRAKTAGRKTGRGGARGAREGAPAARKKGAEGARKKKKGPGKKAAPKKKAAVRIEVGELGGDAAKKLYWADVEPCKWVRLARERHARDLEEGPKRGLWFDEEAADRVIDFLQTHCILWEGEWAGQPMNVTPWPANDILRPVFGWKQLPEGMTARDAERIRVKGNGGATLRARLEAGIYRRFNEVYYEVPRKNAKSTLLAGICLYMECWDFEPGAQVYSAATKRDQAKIIWESAKKMVRRSPALRQLLKTNNSGIYFAEENCKFEPLATNEDSLDGLNVHFSPLDELHKHRNRELYDVLTTSSGARRQALAWMPTTAGEDITSFCYEKHQHAEQVLEGHVEDDAFFAYISCADKDDDPGDERTWAKANPLYNITVKPQVLKKAWGRARSPGSRRAFGRNYLDIWSHGEKKWLNMDHWQACGKAKRLREMEGPADAAWREAVRRSLKGRPCRLGVDLSSTLDMSALAALFPPEGNDSVWRVLLKYWMPEATLRARAAEERQDYDLWEKEGFITATPGEAIDYAFIEDEILEWKRDFDVQELDVDPYNATQLSQRMEAEGIVVVQIAQNYKMLNPPCKELERMLAREELEHYGNPVLTWNAANALVSRDHQGNIRPVKATKSSVFRIDGISALVTALSRAMVEQKPKRSAYADGNLIM